MSRISFAISKPIQCISVILRGLQLKSDAGIFMTWRAIFPSNKCTLSEDISVYTLVPLRTVVEQFARRYDKLKEHKQSDVTLVME